MKDFPDTMPLVEFGDGPAWRDGAHAATDLGADMPPTLPRRAWVYLAVALLALIAASVITAHPCDVDGRHDNACEVAK